MSVGFSIYFGLDNTKEENIELLKQAHKLGFKRIFISLHVPEANYDVLKVEVREFLNLAKEYDMDIVSDISPNTFKFMDLEDKDLKGLAYMGAKTIRIDFGYSEEEIAKMSKNNYGLKVQLNASTITEEFFENLDSFSPDYKNIDALHNFYPRVGTGISEECMIEKNKILKSRGIKPCAFVQSNNRKRSPLKDGLPTLEDHRGLVVKDAAKHLFALENKSVFIGDSLPTLEELKALSSINKDKIELDIELLSDNDDIIRLLKEDHTARTDEARDAIRSSEIRLKLKGAIIEPFNTVGKRYGDITIDNKDYMRYMGELQIIKKEQKGDPRTNVVAKVLEKDLYLLKYITAGKGFCFNITNK
ncbi:MupG family TIM beta-alpha barrel fold protein [Clostridium sp.]|uniref:DUF871 domain-containing protein n=1 Tax=Clostridium sp. TaxID=1506 RepID=UPI0026320D33|nr:MupG family TIM beta-alpha barrel fold protein [Clostridium sp.]